MEFQTEENFPISIIKISKNGKYIFIGFENGKIVKYKLRKEKNNKVYHPCFDKKGYNKIKEKMKLTKIFNKKFPEEKDNKLIEQINKETLGRKTVSNLLKRKSTKNSNSEINIIEEDNNNIYIENSQNKNEQIEISKIKEQKPLIYYINPNIDNISNNYFIFYKNDCHIKFKKDYSKGSANFIFLFFVNEVLFKFSLFDINIFFI